MSDTKPQDSEIKYYATCTTEAMNIRLGPTNVSRIVTKSPTKVLNGETINVYDIDSNGWMKHWHERLQCFVYTRKTNNNKSVFNIKTVNELNTTIITNSVITENTKDKLEQTNTEKNDDELPKAIGYAIVTDKITGQALNFRFNPSTSASTYYQKGIERYFAYPGEKYEIYGISDDGNWAKVIHPETNNIAWLATKRLLFHNNSKATYLDITLYDIETEPNEKGDNPEPIETEKEPNIIDLNDQTEIDAMDKYYTSLFDDKWYEYNGGFSSESDIIKPTKSSDKHSNLATEGSNNLNEIISSFNRNSNSSDDSENLSNFEELTSDNNKNDNSAISTWKEQLNTHAPALVQNESNFPRVIGQDQNGVFKYDYAQNYYENDSLGGIGGDGPIYDKSTGNYAESTFDLLMKNLRKSLDIPSMDSYNDTYKKQLHMYNRFKLPTTNDQLCNSFSHIFFTKPDLNIFGKNGVLDSAAGGIDSFISNMYKMCPTIFSQLTLDNKDGIDQESGTRFMMYLSNKSNSIDIKDEELEVSEYGQTHTGFKLVYGKNTLKARQAGEITIEFIDDKRLTIYKLVRIWIDYISGCYRGLYLPKEEYLTYHALDYASSIYYILCAEDGETVIYWAKFYGVFPVNVPSSQYSKAREHTIKLPQGNYTFKYTIKEEMTPMIIHEFNSCTSPIHSEYGSIYSPNFDPETLNAGTWVGTPFITLEKDASGAYIYKLRFRPYGTTNYREPSATRDK